MRNIIIYLASMYFLNACNDYRPRKGLIQDKQVNDDIGYAEIVGKMDVKMLISIVDSSNCMYSRGIGIEGKENITFAAFDRLNQLASDSLLLQLSYSSNPVMRAYSYNALRYRNRVLASSVKKRLKNDTARLCWITNDMDLTCTISFFVSNTE